MGNPLSSSSGLVGRVTSVQAATGESPVDPAGQAAVDQVTDEAAREQRDSAAGEDAAARQRHEDQLRNREDKHAVQQSPGDGRPGSRRTNAAALMRASSIPTTKWIAQPMAGPIGK